MTPAGREQTRRYVERLDHARATLAAEVEADAEIARDLSLEERGRWVARLCRSAWLILRARTDFRRIVAAREPPAADWLDKWRSMHARLRVRREAPHDLADSRQPG